MFDNLVFPTVLCLGKSTHQGSDGNGYGISGRVKFLSKFCENKKRKEKKENEIECDFAQNYPNYIAILGN